MARRRRARRPWYRTRAYRLTRTLVMSVCLVVGGVWWAGEDEPTDATANPAQVPVAADGNGSGDARGTKSHRAEGEGDGRGAKSHRADADGRGGANPLRPAPTRPVRPARPKPPPRPLPRSPAASLAIPYFGLEAPVMGLGLDRQRRLTAPPVDDPKLVGWYEGGPTPGEPGTAVAVGHLDTRTGPAVFAAIGQLRPGRLVEARRADGRTAVYTVDAVKTYEKAHFPNKEVYGDRGRPELRLITCGGTYDRKKGYASNVVVFAHLTETRGRARGT
ncbi:class F sortase [Streptomyces sp. NPDC058256]|uniref:class F sortase n=1 Tax=Streptomyces sp. NPDC058256 TaxID=3346408 RepID=UPI0036EC3513